MSKGATCGGPGRRLETVTAEQCLTPDPGRGSVNVGHSPRGGLFTSGPRAIGLIPCPSSVPLLPGGSLAAGGATDSEDRQRYER